MSEPTQNDHAAAQRAYWTNSMVAAFEFMETMRSYPVEECGEPMASLMDASNDLEVHFSTTLLNDRFPRVFYCRAGLVESFRKIAREMNDCGWMMKVEDGYRSPEMQRAQSHSFRNFDFILKKVMWELNGKVPDPGLMLRRVGAMIALRCRVGTHVSGSAIDVTILDRTTGTEIDRGGPYLEFSERTPMESPFITTEALKNRLAIQEIFHRNGWRAYPWEFWHFSSGDCYAEFLSGSGKASRYGAIEFAGGSITPMSAVESDQLLEPLEFYQKQIELALARI